jgi:hypothetical protein
MNRCRCPHLPGFLDSDCHRSISYRPADPVFCIVILLGFLYVDGHVRAYHGQRAISSNACVARRHLAMPASTDYWVNDSSGDPLLVITGEVDAALTKAMPRLLREVRDVVVLIHQSRFGRSQRPQCTHKAEIWSRHLLPQRAGHPLSPISTILLPKRASCWAWPMLLPRTSISSAALRPG